MFRRTLDRPTDAPTDRRTDATDGPTTTRRNFCAGLGLLAAGGSRTLATEHEPEDTVLRAELEHGVLELVLYGVAPGDTIEVAFQADGYAWWYEVTADPEDPRWSWDHDRARFEGDMEGTDVLTGVDVDPATLWTAAEIVDVRVSGGGSPRLA